MDVCRRPLLSQLHKKMSIFLYVRVFWDPVLSSIHSTVTFVDISYSHSVTHVFFLITIKNDLKTCSYLACSTGDQH